MLLGLAVLAGACAQAQTPPRTPAELGGLRLPTHFAPECMAIPYEPLPVYDAPGGLRIGLLVLDHPEYARRTTRVCSFRPQPFFEVENNKRRVPVSVLEVGYEEAALSVYEVRTHQGVLWARGRTEQSNFWLPVSNGAQYVSYERDLAQGLERFTEQCQPDTGCRPVSRELEALVRQAGEERRDGCYGNAYDIEAVVDLPGGRRGYRVRLAESLVPKYQGRLPEETVVPTYDYRGRWTGFFFSRGC